MRKIKKRNIKYALVILLLLVSVGYAFLNTTLNINGTSTLKNAKWDIHWENPQVVEGSVSTVVPTIDSLRTTATFNVELEKPGDFYEFTIDAKNDGTIDGMISEISYKLNDTEISETNKLPSYVDYKVTYSDDNPIGLNHKLKASRKEIYKVRVEYKKDIESTDLPEEEVELKLDFSVTYIQANENAEIRNNVCSVATYDNGSVSESRYLDVCESYIDESIYTYSNNDDGTITITGFKDDVEVEQLSTKKENIKASKLVKNSTYQVEKVETTKRTITFKDNVWALPTEIDGKKVTKISGDAFNEKGVSAILIISPTITEIENGRVEGSNIFGAFRNNNLTSVAIPQSVKTIGMNAFASNKLTELKFQEGTETIGIGAFSSNQLEDIEFSNTIKTLETGSFSNNQLTSITMTDSIITVDASSFQNNQIKTLKLSENLELIGELAFSNNEIEKLNIPDSVKTINNGAFQNNSPLKEIKIGDGLKLLDPVFENDLNIEKVILGDGLETIGYGVFDQNTKLAEVKFGKNLKIIRDGAFYNTGISQITLPSKLETIGGGAFAYTKLKKVVIPDSVTTIDGNAFNNITTLEELIIGNGVTTLNKDTYDNTALKKLVIGNGVTTIESDAFANAELEELSIGSGIDSYYGSSYFPKCNNSLINATINSKIIPGGAFYEYTKLKKVIVKENVETIQGGSFYNSSIETIEFSNGLKKIESSAFWNSKLQSLSLPDTIEEIGSGAFYNNNITGTLILPNSLTKIETSAFAYNNITAVKINSSLTELGQTIFLHNNISSVTIPSNIKTIREEVFGYNNISTLKLEEGLESIRDVAFRNNNLTTVTIPTTVTTIKKGAFLKDSTSNTSLTKIINKTGRAFAWNCIVLNDENLTDTFITGITSNDITIANQ